VWYEWLGVLAIESVAESTPPHQAGCYHWVEGGANKASPEDGEQGGLDVEYATTGGVVRS
jgi:hypothetical protein